MLSEIFFDWKKIKDFPLMKSKTLKSMLFLLLHTQKYQTLSVRLLDLAALLQHKELEINALVFFYC